MSAVIFSPEIYSANQVITMINFYVEIQFRFLPKIYFFYFQISHCSVRASIKMDQVTIHDYLYLIQMGCTRML